MRNENATMSNDRFIIFKFHASSMANSAILCPNAFLHESAVREKREKVNETPEKCVRVSILICVGSKSKGDHAQFLPPSEAS